MASKPINQTNISPTLLDQLQNQSAAKVNAEKTAERKKDRVGGYDVTLSDRARDLSEARSKAQTIARGTDPVRMDLVDSIKQRIAAGTYEVSAENIADGILREAIKDKLAVEE